MADQLVKLAEMIIEWAKQHPMDDQLQAVARKAKSALEAERTPAPEAPHVFPQHTLDGNGRCPLCAVEAAAPEMLRALQDIIAEANQSNGGKGAKLPIVIYMKELAEAAIAGMAVPEAGTPEGK